MFIKWKYNDHGWPDFKELEIPDYIVSGYDNEDWAVIGFLEHRNMVPTWSERYISTRIKWEKIDKPSDEYIDYKITDLKNNINWSKKEISRLKKLKKK